MSTLTVDSRNQTYCLVMNEQEARDLGTLWYRHVIIQSPLHKILAGLPHNDKTFSVSNGLIRGFVAEPKVKDDIKPLTMTAGPWIIERKFITGWQRSGNLDLCRNFDTLNKAQHAFAQSKSRHNSAYYRALNVETGEELDLQSGNSAISDYPALLLRYMTYATTKTKPPQWVIEFQPNPSMPGYWIKSGNPGMRGVFGSRGAAENALLLGEKANAPYRVRNLETSSPAPEIFSNIPKSSIPEAPEKKWIIQFKGATSPWGRIVGNAMGADEEFTSRNAAYRAMRKRVRMYPGFNADGTSNQFGDYRVVPLETANGPESDRGYYTIEYWSTICGGQWAPVVNGSPGTMPSRYTPKDGRYVTAASAKAALEKYGFNGSTYRVRWHPSK